MVTLAGGGGTFYEAATVLAAFARLDHWFEKRTLLDLAPLKATVIRGAALEISAAEVVAGDLLLVRPATRSQWTGSWSWARARSTNRW